MTPLDSNTYGARILADSIYEAGPRLVTMEVCFPRFVLAEVNTHRIPRHPVRGLHSGVRLLPARLWALLWDSDRAERPERPRLHDSKPDTDRRVVVVLYRGCAGRIVKT